MRPVPAVFRAVVALALLSLVTAGCSDSKDSKDSTGRGQSQPQVKSPPKPAQGADETAYYRCLEDQGIALETTNDGMLRVRKGKDNNAAILAAEKKCAGLQPSPATASATEEDMVRARKLSACLREHGVKDYPDPGPGGDAPLSAELAHAMKTDPDYRKANRACDPRPDGDSVAGG
ncbi:hypothetical protein [Streptomyces sp. NPDC048669]|uniref:hypothetical protein n=1 Tax=Streptomyces sp. NPDC048669 TaxID=3155267 RepID=UPI003426F037